MTDRMTPGAQRAADPRREFDRRRFLTGGTAAGLGAVGLHGLMPPREAAAQPPAERPNIIVILADDVGYSDLGCYGSEISTPHLDRLGFEGLRMTQVYGDAVCAPARASLLTGLYPTQAGVGYNGAYGDGQWPQYQGYLRDTCVTLPEVLGSAGYRTGMSGKWHVGGTYHNDFSDDIVSEQGTTVIPATRGFERSFGILGGADSFYNPGSLFRDMERIRASGERFHLTDAISEEAVAQVDEFAEDEDPFFLFVSYTAPHWPLHAWAEDIKKYRGTYLDGWDEIRKRRWQRQLDLGLADPRWEFPDRQDPIPDWESVPFKEWHDGQMAAYAAMIEQMDRGIGTILERLAAHNLNDDTLIIFLSDNGACSEHVPGFGGSDLQTRDGRKVRWGNDPDIMPGPDDTWQSYGNHWANVSNSPLTMYKHFMREGGISSPSLAYWPGVIESGRIDHQPRRFIDIMPTLVEVAGADYPREFGGNPITPGEGVSFVDLLHDRDASVPDRTIFGEAEGNRTARKGQWKAVSNFPGDWELYNIDADRTEQNDLADDQPVTLEELTTAYEEWAERVDIIPWAELDGYDSDDNWIGFQFSTRVAEITASGEYLEADWVKENLNDGDESTKWLVFEGTAWVQYALHSPMAAVRYTLTSANDLPERDPRSWELQGSYDGETWDILDSRTDQTFRRRHQAQEYWFVNRSRYAHYRLNITDNNGAPFTQLAEWGLSDDHVVEITASFERSDRGEPKENLNDGDVTTRWQVPFRHAWVQYELGTQMAASWYELASADEPPGRDPRDWELQGSPDGRDWTTLDTRTDQEFPERFQRRKFRLDNTTDYLFYRLTITRTNGDSSIQLAEWRLSDVPEGPDEKIVGVTASGDRPDLGHPMAYLNDRDPTTKWYVDGETAWVQYQLDSAAPLTWYALTSANDAPDRDPRDWELQGSPDGQDWTTLDTRNDQEFSKRFQRRKFPVENSADYLYYRLSITGNNGADSTHLAEWELSDLKTRP